MKRILIAVLFLSTPALAREKPQRATDEAQCLKLVRKSGLATDADVEGLFDQCMACKAKARKVADLCGQDEAQSFAQCMGGKP